MPQVNELSWIKESFMIISLMFIIFLNFSYFCYKFSLPTSKMNNMFKFLILT